MVIMTQGQGSQAVMSWYTHCTSLEVRSSATISLVWMIPRVAPCLTWVTSGDSLTGENPEGRTLPAATVNRDSVGGVRAHEGVLEGVWKLGKEREV